MAAYKSQHFVPRCYLRQFSSDSSNKSISLLQVGSGRFVCNASIKNQCAKPYLYGDDLELEQALKTYEDKYAHAFRRVSAQSRSPRDVDLKVLRDFMVLQSSRTVATIQKTKMVWQGTQNVINTEHPGSILELDSSTYHMMLMTISMYMKIRKHLIDLKVCIIRNKTCIPFITSDDPVAFTSMFHAEKLHTDQFGFGSAGALFFFPLSPKLLLLCYDADVYILNGKLPNSISISKKRDVRACNELQFLKAVHAIYFSDWKHRCELNGEFNTILPRRKRFEPVFNRYAPDGIKKEGQRYRRLDKDEKVAEDQMLISFSFPQVLPSSWISSLRFRKNTRYFYDGSAAGHVRRHFRRTDLGR